MWRVQAEYAGRVAIESGINHVVLSDDLTQEQLALLAKSPLVAGFMEQTTQPVTTDEG